MTNSPQLNTFNNKWYKPGKNAFVRFLWYCINATFLNSAFPISKIKIFWLKIFGAKIGKGAVIKPYVNVKYPWRLEIGDYTWIGEQVWIDNLDNIIIGKNVCISQGALLLTGNHDYKKSTFDLIIAPIKINDGAWLGAKTIVTQNVEIGEHAVLTVGSVASKNIEANYIYKGNPAEKVKPRS